MIFDILENVDYKDMIEDQIYEILEYLVNNGEEFSLTTNIKGVEFNPQIPQPIYDNFQPFTLFTLANYTFSTISLDEDFITFEAGFGSENFGSVVSIPLFAIFQIVINESILYLNPLATVEKYFEEDVTINDFEEESEKRSLNAFKKNRNNKNLF